MSEKKLEGILRTGTRILLGFASIFVQPAWAGQSQQSQYLQNSARNASTLQGQEKQPAPPPAKVLAVGQERTAMSTAVAEESPSGGGAHEGIKVHGHWTIEVRNPDGTLVTHREFENSLYAGSLFFAQIAGRQLTVGGWGIVLLPAPLSNNSIRIDEAGSVFAAGDSATCAAYPQTIACSQNLTVAVVTATLTLAGSGVVPSSFGPSVGLVSTGNFLCAPTTTPQACPTSPYSTSGANYPVTTRTLDGLNGDPAAVSVSPGQIVQVKVVISFS